MNTAIKFHKAKLHFHPSKFHPTKPDPQAHSQRVCSTQSETQKTTPKHYRTLTEFSSSPDKFSDKRIRLTVWNVLASKLKSEVDALKEEEGVIHASGDVEPHCKPISGNLNKFVQKHKLHKEKYPCKTGSRNVEEIQVQKINPHVNNNNKNQKASFTFCKYAKSPPRSAHNKAKPLISLNFRRKFNSFRQTFSSYAQKSPYNNTWEIQQSPVSYTLNVSNLMKRTHKTDSGDSCDLKKRRITTCEEVQGWTHRSRDSQMALNISRTQNISKIKNQSYEKKKLSKSLYL